MPFPSLTVAADTVPLTLPCPGRFLAAWWRRKRETSTHVMVAPPGPPASAGAPHAAAPPPPVMAAMVSVASPAAAPVPGVYDPFAAPAARQASPSLPPPQQPTLPTSYQPFAQLSPQQQQPASPQPPPALPTSYQPFGACPELPPPSARPLSARSPLPVSSGGVYQPFAQQPQQEPPMSPPLHTRQAALRHGAASSSPRVNVLDRLAGSRRSSPSPSSGASSPWPCGRPVLPPPPPSTGQPPQAASAARPAASARCRSRPRGPPTTYPRSTPYIPPSHWRCQRACHRARGRLGSWPDLSLAPPTREVLARARRAAAAACTGTMPP